MEGRVTAYREGVIRTPRPIPCAADPSPTARHVALGLVAAWCANDLEELLTIAASSRDAFQRAPAFAPIPGSVRARGLSQAHVTLAIALMGVLITASAARGARTGFRDRLSRAVLLGFGLHGFGHLAASAAARGYTSGVITAPTVVIPVWLWARRRLRGDGIDDVTPAVAALAVALTAPTTAAVHVLAGAILRDRSLGPVR